MLILIFAFIINYQSSKQGIISKHFHKPVYQRENLLKTSLPAIITTHNFDAMATPNQIAIKDCKLLFIIYAVIKKKFVSSA